MAQAAFYLRHRRPLSSNHDGLMVVTGQVPPTTLFAAVNAQSIIVVLVMVGGNLVAHGFGVTLLTN